MDWLTDLAINIVSAIAVIILTFWVANFVKSQILKAGKRNEELDETLFSFLSSLARYLILAVGGMAVLGMFGIETTSVVALLGAAGLAIGLALQGTLSSVAAGVMLVIFRPLKLGDFVTVAGESGTVASITLFTTELTTPDNVQIIIPNSNVWGQSVVNFSYHDTRRVDLTFGVSYDSDLKAVEKIITDQIAAQTVVKSEPAPFVKVTNLGDSSVDFTVRIWCDSADYWDLKFDLTRKVKEAFDAGGIDIPFPTQLQINKDV